ncbi:hypothetical protein BG015_008330 [Linnemannia schmuckeri]|uniref:Xylanolytic transcriptional activator regulatory domain-containing protein n=1 Tax=Linnemannia schmuckeri TaxID=64567 RepID=A0A9P5S0J5_9FUNG|nr:hypothetical protein BG015_008330 [Linnemannia schmuckeri]
MARSPCDGGSPCRTCQLNRVRCHYEDDNNNMQSYESNGNTSPLGHQRQQQQQFFNHHHRHNHHQQQQQQQGQDKGRNTTDDRQTFHSGTHSSRSRSGSDSGSASGSGSGSSSSSNEGSHRSNSQEGSLSSSFHGPPFSPQHMRVSPPQTSDHATVISIPPFQEFPRQQLQQNAQQEKEQDYPRQNNKVTLPSISSLSMNSSITPLTSAASLLSTSSSSFLANSNSQSPSSSSSTQTTSPSSPSRSTTTKITATTLSDRDLDGSSSSSKPRPVRPILPAQSHSAPRLLQPASFDAGFSSKRHNFTKNHHAIPQHQQPQQTQQQQQRSSQTPGDTLYSLSTASIRARKNALEMENIQRASQLYEDYIAKIKAVSESIPAALTTTTPSFQNNRMNPHRMDIDSADFTTNTGSYNPYPNKPARLSPLGEKDFGPIEGLQRMLRSGMLHNLVQQYFTLIHPQFMILHKNQFLIRFWAEYGPFPEAYEIHNQFNGKPCSGKCGAESGVVEHNMDTCAHVTAAAPAAVTEPLSSPAPVKSNYRNSPLLLLSMMALVSRHLNDRSPMKSTIEEKHRRVQKSLYLYSHDREVVEHRCQEKLQEGKLQELMETDEHGHRDLDGENFRDRGEQYFYWATELLKFEYEEPSLTVIQSLLLLREYAVMAGSHTQAYMYGGTAITMALVLGWDRAHLLQNSRNGADGQPGIHEFVKGSEEEKAAQEKQRENKAKDEEQRLCWWQCFIVDRWMSAAYNRPVNIPVHVFDKTHLGLAPKIISISRPGDDSSTIPTTGTMDPGTLPMGSGVPSPQSVGLPPAQYRAKSFFDQQCRQALLLDDILAFLSTWSDELFVNPAKFDKLSGALDEWHRDLADWQTFPLSGIVSPPKSSSRPSSQKYNTTIPVTTLSNGGSISGSNKQHQQERRDIVQSTLLGISFHTIRILLYRPFLRTNLRHPPCIPSRASLACAQSANAMTSLAESLINLTDATVQPCLLMRHQFSLVTAAGIQLMNASLEDEPRLSTPAKINLLKTIRILRDADRSTFGGPTPVVVGDGNGGAGGSGVRDGFHQVLRELFPGQMKHMPSLLGPSTSSSA